MTQDFHTMIPTPSTARLPRCLVLAAAFLVTTCVGLAQGTPIGGSLSGTLTAGVYSLISSATVPGGQTLTLDPGVIIKCNGAYSIAVQGTLFSNGTASNPVILTDGADDSAGGDTNNNGPSAGAPGAWYGVSFGASSDASVLSYTEVRYAGYGNFDGIYMNGADVTLDHCTVRDCAAAGMDFNNASRPSVTNCSVLNNGGRAWDAVPLMAVPGMTDNLATGNGLDCLWISNATLSGSTLDLQVNQMVGGAFHLNTSIVVPAGMTLSFAPGVIVKVAGARQVIVQGALSSNGDAAAPVIFTDDADDSAGGDTNKDGPSSGVPGSWYNLRFSSSIGSVMHHTEVRYAGYALNPGVSLNSSDIDADQCVVRDCAADGFDLAGSSYPTISNCSVLNNGGRAWDSVQLMALPGMSNNAAFGNALDCLYITGAQVTANLQLQVSQMVGGAFHFATTLSIPTGVTLTCDAGTVIKFASARQVVVDGTLACNGTAAAPVVFTDDGDDSAGGDTNKDGPSSGVPGSWYNLSFTADADASALTYTEVRFAGYANFAAVNMSGADITMDRCTVRDCNARGLNLQSNSTPTVTGCAVLDNGGNAFDSVSINAIPGMTNNTASGNALDCLRVTSATVSGAVRIGTASMVGGAFLFTSTVSVPNGAALTMEQGCIVKWTGPRQLIANGTLDLRGTSYEPVVFTDDGDDEYGGDSMKDGPTTGVAGSYYNLVINGSAVATLENVLIRYAGGANYSALECNSVNAGLRSVRVEKSGGSGFRLLNAQASPVNLVAYDCGGNGFWLVGGVFDLVHATAVDNGGNGINASASWSGTVANCNCFQNAGGNYSTSLTGSNVTHSNGGLSGISGNLDVDPLFVDLANGDLHLSAASPCLAAAAFAYGLATVKDHDERSRILSHTLTGNFEPDMGAYEFSNWRMDVGGSGAIGDDVVLTVQGLPGISVYAFGFLDGALMIPDLGFILAGLPGFGLSFIDPTAYPVGLPYTLSVPNQPALVGAQLGAQALTLSTQTTAFSGNLTEVCRVLVRQ